MPSIDYETRTAADFEISSVSGQRSVGGGALVLTATVTPRLHQKDEERFGLLHVTWAQLECDLGVIGVAPVGANAVGLNGGSPHVIAVIFPLATEQIVKLDAARSDHGLSLMLSLRGFVDGAAGLAPFYQRVVVPVSNATWCAALAAMRFVHRALFEVTIESDDPCQEVQQALKHYRRALDHLAGRHWAEAVAAAREAMDAVGMKGLRSTGTDQNLQERIEGIGRAVRHATHAGHHAAIGVPSADDARLIVRAAGLVLEHFRHSGK